MPRRTRPLAAVLLVFVLAVVLAVVVALGGARFGRRSAGSSPAPARPGQAVVARVVDGDTIRVRLGGREERVRLIGIDTPETKDPRRPVGCFGKEASARTEQLLPEGSGVRLVRDVEARDRYGRLLAYVYRSRDNVFVNLALVREGFAVVLTYPPNVAHTDAFVAAAAAAREAGRGLWSRCAGADLPAP